ncbi:hypothetical protein PPYR_14307 [Photinus pyralis]|nr:hypothetical protein PPYR_14307 [Photinus pyralis]
MSASSDSSGFFASSDFEVENYDEYLAKIGAEEEELRLYDLQRPHKFETYLERERNIADSIFNLPALKCLKFTHRKLKFAFTPSEVAQFVSKRLVFIISLKYRMGYWMVKRDYLPVNYKWRIYKLFYTSGRPSHFRFTDENIVEAVHQMWKILCEWAAQDEEFRRRKRDRYRNGEDLFLDEHDEELFLSEGEVEELHRKRNAIWERMLPPKPAKRARRHR